MISVSTNSMLGKTKRYFRTVGAWSVFGVALDDRNMRLVVVGMCVYIRGLQHEFWYLQACVDLDRIKALHKDVVKRIQSPDHMDIDHNALLAGLHVSYK